MQEELASDAVRIESFDDDFRYRLRKLQRHPAYLYVKTKLRAARRLLPNAWRMATHEYRQLPAAVIVGAAKCGTTQLFAYLTRHPRCFGGTRKEIDYFSRHADRPLAWYRSRFPLRRTVDRVGGICLEASPSYLPLPEALHRMHDVLPDAAVIVVLRAPVDRAFSRYQHLYQRRFESRSFEEMVHEAVRGGQQRAGATGRQTLPTSLSANVADCIAGGYYAEQIDALLRLYPRQQVLVLDSADLFDDTNATCQRVFDFLGLERFDVKPQKIYNRGFYRETIEPTTAALLQEHYRPHDQRLVALLGQRFRWMDADVAAATIRRAA